MNYSIQKEIILKALQENVVHPTADYLYSKISKEYPTLGIATVYRNLKKMSDCGLIKKIEGLDNSTHYDHNTFEHYHFICENCKRVFDISSAIAPDIVVKTEQETGFEIKKCDIAFSGLCKDCKKIKESEESL